MQQPDDDRVLDEGDDDGAPAASQVALVEDDLLIEDVSIDGMCGVY